MSTIIYPSPIFGPVKSRRLGLSLGINLLPADGKVCTFDCIYCECGLNSENRPTLPLPTRQDVGLALGHKLRQMAEQGQRPDVLTFAGNGEPTCHPDFAAIIGDAIQLRDRFCPTAKVSVLSNGTQIHRPAVRDALMLVDNNIQKLDTIDPEFISRVDRPTGAYDVNATIGHLKAFNGHVIIQTMFLCGPDIDNTTPHYVEPWLQAVSDIKPQQVMVYTVDRETPYRSLRKVSRQQLDAIRDQVIAAGIPCTASY